jgi:uncharacterized membrane protein YvbJ
MSDLQSGTRENKTVQEYQKKQKRQKLIFRYTFLILFVIAVTGTGAYFYAEKQTDRSVVIEEFKQAVKEKEIEKLVKLINHGNSEIKANKKMAEAYIQFLKENEIEYNKALDELRIQDGGMVKDSRGNRWFSLEKDGKLWGYFDKYKIAVQPYYIEATSNFKYTEFFLNDDSHGELDEEKRIKIGPILPGSYTLAAKCKGTYSTLEKEKELNFAEAQDNLLEVVLPLEGVLVNIITNALGIGPFAPRDKIEIFAKLETDGGPITSNTVQVTREEDIYLDFDYSNAELVSKGADVEIEEKEDPDESNETDFSNVNEYDLSSFMNNFIQESVIAINTHDFNAVSSYLNENAPGYKETKEYLDYTYEKGITEEFQSLTLLDYKQLDEGNLEVKTEEEYTIYFADGTNKYKKFISRYSVSNNYSGFLVNRLLSTKEIE